MPIAMRRLQQNDSIRAYDGLKNRSSNGPSFYTSLKSPCFPFCFSIVSLLGILCLQFHRRVYVYRMSVRPSVRRIVDSSSRHRRFFFFLFFFSCSDDPVSPVSASPVGLWLYRPIRCCSNVASGPLQHSKPTNDCASSSLADLSLNLLIVVTNS